jgi:hypothetical protein
LKPSPCDIATAVRVPEAIELRFGRREARSPGTVGAAMTHRVRLDLQAARHLEEILARVLGLLESAPGTGAPQP